MKLLSCVEICTGAGGQALGLAMAGFVHVALVEYEADYCKVLKDNTIKSYDLIMITTAHSNVDYDMVQKNARYIFDTKNAMKNVVNRENIEVL